MHQGGWESWQGSHPAVVGGDPEHHRAMEASLAEAGEGDFLVRLLLGMGEGRGGLDHRVLQVLLAF